MKPTFVCLLAGLCLLALGCSQKPDSSAGADPRLRVILDTDANNELDDQHAIAYLLFNGDVFDVAGITVNRTFGGGGIDEQYAEAERVLRLCLPGQALPLFKGADKSFVEIEPDSSSFDGSAAVDFIIGQAKASVEDTLVLIAVGKLTNVALALKKDPAISRRMRVVWLGSNYPEPGEYNQDNDTAAMNYVLGTDVPFEMVTVRYGLGSGTDEVRVTRQEIGDRMPGKGPEAEAPVTGRHGGSFTHFGDYSVNLFEHIQYDGDPPSRALFDMAAVAIVKNPEWARPRQIPAPVYAAGQWVERPDNPRRITVWEHFDRARILDDFFQRMEHYQLVSPTRQDN